MKPQGPIPCGFYYFKNAVFSGLEPLEVRPCKGIGGHFRVEVAKELGITEIPVVYVNIPELEREKELNLRLNKNTGDFDLELLKEFDETFLHEILRR